MARFRSVKLWRKSRQETIPAPEPVDPVDPVIDEPVEPVEVDEPIEPPKPKHTTTIGKIQVYPDVGGEWRWRMVRPNGRKFAVSGESFASKSNAKRAANRLTLIDTSLAEVEVLDD